MNFGAVSEIYFIIRMYTVPVLQIKIILEHYASIFKFLLNMMLANEIYIKINLIIIL